MVIRRSQVARAGAYRILLIQLVLALFASIAVFYCYDGKHAYSVLLGAAICIVPNSLFIWQIFANTGAKQSKQVISGFFKAEVSKIVLTVGLFYGVMKTIPVVVAPMILTYVAMYLFFSLAPLTVDNSKSGGQL